MLSVNRSVRLKGTPLFFIMKRTSLPTRPFLFLLFSCLTSRLCTFALSAFCYCLAFCIFAVIRFRRPSFFSNIRLHSFLNRTLATILTSSIFFCQKLLLCGEKNAGNLLNAVRLVLNGVRHKFYIRLPCVVYFFCWYDRQNAMRDILYIVVKIKK